MKKLLFLFLTWPGCVFAADVFPIAKAEEFLSKKMQCELAVAHVIKATDKQIGRAHV